MLRSRILTGLVIATFAGVFGSQIASCTLDQEGTTPVEVSSTPCPTTGQCDDGNPCTIDSCDDVKRVCLFAKQADGPAPNAVQTANDCKTIMCTDGSPAEQDDAEDVYNDNNPCTMDACSAGMPTNENMPDGSMCTQGVKTGSCTAGVCEISCTTNIDCDDKLSCSDDLCNTSTGKCVYTNLDGVPDPAVTQTVGDCKFAICENGLSTVINDDADVKDDSNPCTADVCNNGAPENNVISEGTACTPGDLHVCDGKGACVECTVASHCVSIIETECEKRSCVNNTCQIAYQGQDTLASATLQTAGNCKKIVCNGNMGTTEISDDADLPVDGNACTKDICTNGAPSNPPEALNLNCGGTQVCDGNGNCVGCTSANMCPGTDDFCKTRTCINTTCGFSYTPNGTDLPTGQTAGDCKVLECDGAGNVKTSVLTSDVPVDGNQCTQDNCNAQGTPSNPPTGINSACNVNGNDACDGNGNCKKSLGKTCAMGPDCVSTNCVDGVCCSSTCTTTCRACNVPGNLGTCTDVPKGQDDGMCSGANQSCNGANNCDFENGQACAGNNSCLSNFCADGVCCDSACSATCKSCNVPGNVGTCSNLPAGSQDNAPTNLCVGSSQCDGNGVCKKVVGTNCGNNNECLSGFCVDGVCCATTCGADCKSCNIAGSVGTCSNVAMGNDDGTCSGATKSCDGMGGCKVEQGGTCAMGTECFSTFCVDGVCCNNACTTLCEACTSAKTGMTTGTCNPVTAGADPDNECSPDAMSTCGLNGSCDGAGACQKYTAGTTCMPGSCAGTTETAASQCNGTGTCVAGMTSDCGNYVCGATTCKTTCGTDADCSTGNYCAAPNCVGKKANGQACTASNQCQMGNCIDGVCCSTACTGQCQVCSAAGTCGMLTTGEDTNSTPQCSGTMGCNPTGMCLKKTGQPCNNNNDCISDVCSGSPMKTCQ